MGRHTIDWKRLLAGLAAALVMGGCGADDADASGDPMDTLDAASATGCNVRDTWPEACDAVAIPGIRVTVTDGAGGPQVCDATVTVFAHGTTTEGRALEATSAEAPCSYVDWWGQEGSWDITATTAGGATGGVTGVTVCLRESGCHLDTVDVTIAVE